MSILDWSDPDEMIGLLAEWLRDAGAGEQRDPRRSRFLTGLSAAVEAIAEETDIPLEERAARLESVADDHASEFEDDEALRHVRDCIEELSRISLQRRS